MKTDSARRVAIIGAGIIGLSCAWELSKRGANVTVFEKNWPPRGASWAAAGMLAPAYEAAAEEGAHPRLFDLCMESAGLWQDFAADLEAATGERVGYHPGPTLAVAVDPDEAQRLAALCEALEARGVPYQRLSVSEARVVEPALTNDLHVAVCLSTDGWVDNRSVLNALIKACEASGVRFEVSKDGASALTHDGEVLAHDGYDCTLLAAGWESAVVPVCFPGERGKMVNVNTHIDEVDCYGGHILSVAREANSPQNTIRSGAEYIVPRGTERVIGATMEPGVPCYGDGSKEADGLVAKIARAVPSVADAVIVSRWSGTRPGTDDKAPLLGMLQADSLYVAAGHYRNGILLAPITAKIMADMIIDGQIGELAAAFTPDRFSTVTG